MRRIICTTASLAALVLLPAPANAKVPAEVEISGPGLEAPLVLGDPEAFEYANLTGIAGYHDEVEAPPADVGPRYIVRFTLMTPNPREAVQHLYPFAEGGPLTYTPAGQRLFTGPQPLPSGWAEPDPALADLLDSNGLARPAPAASEPAAVTVGSPPTSVLLALGVIGALLAGAAAVDKQRRLRSEAP